MQSEVSHHSGDRAEPLIALTAGEPAGIGPDLIIAVALEPLDARLIAFCDPDLLSHRAQQLGRPVEIHTAREFGSIGPHIRGHLNVWPVPLAVPAVPGRPDPLNAPAILESITRAVNACREGAVDAIVTTPVNKALINDSGTVFSGHTEFIGELCSAFPVMMLMSDALRVILVTTHLPLSEVCAAITRERVERTIIVADADLRSRFGIRAPALLVCGLNPHAGESGHLGDEESRIIVPALAGLRHRGLNVVGPVAADTAFTPAALKGIDAVIAMYHDQGLGPLKALGFGSIVNVTLGLPIIRTSVDHGTALELAATGRARPDSILAAIQCSIRLAKRQAHSVRASSFGSASTPA